MEIIEVTNFVGCFSIIHDDIKVEDRFAQDETYIDY